MEVKEVHYIDVKKIKIKNSIALQGFILSLDRNNLKCFTIVMFNVWFHAFIIQD